MVASRVSTKSCQPLRERRQVALAIIPISYRDWNRVYDCNCELVLVFEEEAGKKDSGHQKHQKHRKHRKRRKRQTPSPLPNPSLVKESHLVKVVQGLYIALVDDEADVPALRTLDGKPFTHVVQVCYTMPIGNGSLALSDWRREEAPRRALVQRLGLVCPAASLRLCAEQTAVGPNELHAARDFLTLALPHGSTKWWPEEMRKGGQSKRSEQVERDAQVAQDDDADVQVVVLAPDYELDDLLQEGDPVVQEVNVLIVAPTSRAVDVLSVLFCYLAFLEDTTPEDLVETDYCDQVWENVMLGPWSMFYVELVARCD